MAARINNIVNPSITATSDEGTPTWRCIASAPASRNPKNNAAGISASGCNAPSNAMATALKPKP